MLKVLVVDDDHDTTELVAMVASEDGHVVRQAHDGGRALDIAVTWGPDVIVLDLGMPGMTGHDVARSLRARCGRTIRIVGLSGWARDRDRLEAAQAGFDAFLVKPTNTRAICTAIRAR